MESNTRLLLAICFLPLAFAQSTDDSDRIESRIYPGEATGTASTTPTSTASTTPTSTASNTPVSSSSLNSDHDTNMGGLVHYYFVFIALIIILAVLGAFFMYRRSRRALAMHQNGQTGALQQDAGAWDSSRARRRYWQGRWRSTDGHNASQRDEGLNEHGEAPPPYMPKGEQRDEELGLPIRGNGSESATPAVPMQTLSREQTGLKPPGYECAVSEHYGGGLPVAATSSTEMTNGA